MSASPATLGISPSPLRNNQVAIPANWRVKQIVALGAIALLALYYFTIGWKSGSGQTGSADSRSLFDGLGFLVLGALAWLTTPTAWVIATTTFQESLRRRWMTVLLVFGMVMMALSVFFTQFSPGTEEQFIRDFGLGFIIIITMLMSIFLGASLVPPDIERRTIFTILSKPVTRGEFLIGKFLGLCLTMLVSLFLLSVMFLISYSIFKIRTYGWSEANTSIPNLRLSLGGDLVNLSKALLLQFGQISILASLSLLLSLVVSNITAIVFCFVIYFGGQMSSFWEHMGHGHDEGGGPGGTGGVSGPIQGLVNVVSFVLPKLDRFDVRQRIISDLPIEFNYMWKAFGSGFVYVAVLLIFAYLVFSDREF